MAPIWKSVDRKETRWGKKEVAILDRKIKSASGRDPTRPWGQGSGRETASTGDNTARPGMETRSASTACLTDPVVVLSLIWTTKYHLVRKGSLATEEPRFSQLLHLWQFAYTSCLNSIRSLPCRSIHLNVPPILTTGLECLFPPAFLNLLDLLTLKI